MAYGVMFLVCLYITAEGAATLWNAYRVDHTYAPTTATVLEADLGSREDGRGRTVYRPKVRLRYNAGGVAREEWAELDWTWANGSPDRAESDLRGFPVGTEVPAWYDPAWPGRVVVARGCGWSAGLCELLPGLFILALMIGIPGLLLCWTAWRHWTRLEPTTAQVTGGEVRQLPADAGVVFQTVLAVEYDRGATPWQGQVRGGTHPDRAGAEAELGALLSSHPVGEPCAFWYDPADRLEPTFEPLTIPAAVFG
ncbi:MAG TPA: DUF3592 domain-containing protein, partial [Urbifossiella sp.]|nr:DUF3592 domain-containing protein [Urbifossiella sp.]